MNLLRKFFSVLARATSKLNRRERTILALLLGVAFLLGNLLLLNNLFGGYHQINANLRNKRIALNVSQALLAQREESAQRDAWIQQHQPKLEERAQAGVQLLNDLKQTAKENEVTLEKPELREIENQPHYQSVAVQIETQSAWPNLIRFLNQLQQPEKFIVLEKTLIEIDPNDPTKMRGVFTIAKWYAP